MEKIKVLIVAADPAAGMIPFVVTIANTLADDDRFEVHALVVDKEEMSYSDKFAKCKSEGCKQARLFIR